MEGDFEGFLKQQIQGDGGLYEWVRKHFVLHVALAELHVSDASDQASHTDLTLSLVGAKYAKEWSQSAPAIGSYGFDIVWSSGRIWSFLADDETSCKAWVRHINSAISTPRNEPRTSPAKQHFATSEGSIDSDAQEDTIVCDITATSPAATTIRKSTPSTVPYHATLRRGQHAVDVSQEMSRELPGQVDESAQESFVRPSSPTKTRSPTMYEAPTSQDFSVPLSPRSTATGSTSLTYLQKQKIDLQKQLKEALHEAEQAKYELNRFRDTATQKMLVLEKRLSLSKESDWRNATVRNEDIERAIIETQAECHSNHEASLRLLREQHRREVLALQDDLKQQRSRVGEVVEEEKTKRKYAEAQLLEIQRSHDMLLEKHADACKELDRVKHLLEDRQVHWRNEKDKLERQHERHLEEVREEYEEKMASTKSDINRKLEQMKVRYESAAKDIEMAGAQTLRQQMEAEKMLALNNMQKQCTADIAEAKLAEKKKWEAEIAKIHNTYSEREKQTMTDLQQLEQLHGEQLKQLQNEVSMYRERAIAAEELVAGAHAQCAKGAENTRRIAETQKHTIDSNVKQIEELRLILQRTQDALQEATAKESQYRQQLSIALEDNKVQRAELISAQRQAAEDHAQATSWRQVCKESEISIRSYDASLKIAQEEIYMLENNIHRLTEENRTLKASLEYADKVVYGAPPSRISVGSGTPTSTSSKGRKSTHWIPTGKRLPEKLISPRASRDEANQDYAH